MSRFIAFAVLFLVSAGGTFAQCEEWVNPNPTGGWTDFDPVPCNGEFQEINGFEVWQSEAYQFDGCMAGGNYTFSHCNGSSGSWIPEYTVIAPSGAVDAFGAGDGNGCSITWTATESGSYLVVVNEADSCGIEGTVNNGFPMITTNSGAQECPPPPVFVEGAESFEGFTLPTCWIAVDDDADGNGFQLTNAVAFDSTRSIRSDSFINNVGALSPDNYLITPQLQLGEGDSLYYVVISLDPNFVAENYSVLVSTTGNELVDFADEVFTEVLSNTEWEGRSIDLSAYDNQLIYIAFRHHSVTDQFAFALDAVALPGEQIDCSTLSVEENDLSSDFTVFPNPSTGIVNLNNGGQSDQFDIRVSDMLGRIVQSERIFMNTGTSIQLDLGKHEAGIYTITFVSEFGSGSKRIVIQ